MNQITVVFPGQGSQYVGMGKGLADDYFVRASEKLDFDLKGLCLNGPTEELNLTINTQPAILTHSVTLWEKLRPLLDANTVSITRVLGHSVGEYAALVCAGAMDFEDAVLSTRLRGKYMQQAVPLNEGGMMAILKLDFSLVESTCGKVSSKKQKVSVANFNSPDQVVISGHWGALKKVVVALKEQTGQKFRAIPLSVSAPFHSELMKPAAEKLRQHFNHLHFRPLHIPYVANINGKEYPRGTLGKIVQENLVQQIYRSVQWLLSTAVLEKGATVIEVGPGQVLKGLVKKCRPDVTCYSWERDGQDFLRELESK